MFPEALPRTFEGMYSVKRVLVTGCSPPRPIFAKNRVTASDATLQDADIIPVNMAITTTSTMIAMAATTIQISTNLLEQLKNRKMYDKESYEDLIWDLLEDTMELSEETKRHIKQSEKEIREGKVVSLEQVKKKLGL